MATRYLNGHETHEKTRKVKNTFSQNEDAKSRLVLFCGFGGCFLMATKACCWYCLICFVSF